jgi:flavin-dependent dehydrogenase
VSAAPRVVDYAVVGAGPAGLAVGIEAALAGRSAVVLERRAGALDKACGEGLMPRAVARLREMGVILPAEGFHPFHGIRYVDADLAAEARFVDGPGWGVRRTVLSEALLRRAAALGVEVRHGVEARGFAATGRGVRLDGGGEPLEARWLVGADGLHGAVGRAAGFAVRRGARRRFGLRRHVAVAPWSESVEVHWQDGIEAYVTPVSPAEVGVAFLWTAGDDAPADFAAFLERFPALAARLGPAAHAPDAGATRGAGPFAVTVRPAARGRVLLVGDAAGYVDAITGEGIGLAFAAARALVRATTREAGAAAYATALARITRRHRLCTRALLAMAERPALRRRFIRALAASPSGWRGLLALSNGSWGWGRALPSLVAVAVRALSPRRDPAPERAPASS